MPANILIIPYPNFVRATPDSPPKLGAGRQMLVALVSAMREARLLHVLIDTRPGAPTPALENRRWQHGVTAGAPSACAEKRVALLVPQDEHDDAQFFEDIAGVDGAKIQAFTDFETAIGWLILRER